MKRKSEVETVMVPHEYMTFADHRTAAIVRRCCFDPNIIESIARSCYLQGVMDGVQVAAHRPDVAKALFPDDVVGFEACWSEKDGKHCRKPKGHEGDCVRY